MSFSFTFCSELRGDFGVPGSSSWTITKDFLRTRGRETLEQGTLSVKAESQGGSSLETTFEVPSATVEPGGWRLPHSGQEILGVLVFPSTTRGPRQVNKPSDFYLQSRTGSVPFPSFLGGRNWKALENVRDESRLAGSQVNPRSMDS